MKNVQITVTKDGKLLFDYQGFQGKNCFIEADKIWEELKKLGIKGEDVTVKPHKITDDPMQKRKVKG